MKIGILTFHRAINYGAVLQCYSLSETLKSLGHEVEIIDYRPEYIERYRRILPLFLIRRIENISDKIKTIAESILKIGSTIDANKRFDNFLYKHFTFSNIVYRDTDIIQNYDVIIFGSDQIWSPQICYGYDQIYYGQFPKGNTRFIAYAASIGGHNKLTAAEWKIVKNYLLNFDTISVRENQLKTDLQNIGLPTTVVVDPTILANPHIFEEIAVRPKNIPQRYVLVFSVAPTSNLMGFAHKIAKQTESKIVIVNAKKSTFFFHKRKRDIIEITPKIEEFLGLFKFATCIVTVSFHGTVFSVLFRKDFYSLYNYMQDRAQHFLTAIGLEHRLVSTSNEAIANLQFESIDYSSTEDRMNTLRHSSLEFIRQALRI